MKVLHATILAVIGAVSAGVAARAADAGGAGAATPPTSAPSAVDIVNDAAKNASLFDFSYGPPASPSLALLGLSGSKASPSSSLAPFLLAIPTTLSGSGGQYAGLNVSFLAIASAVSPKDQNLESKIFRDLGQGNIEAVNYDNNIKYFLARTHFDFGLTNGQSNSDVTKEQLSGIAIGVSASVLPFDNPLQVSRFADGSRDRYFTFCTTQVVLDEQAIVNGLVDKYNDQFKSFESEQQGLIDLLYSNAGVSVIKTYSDNLKEELQRNSVSRNLTHSSAKVPALDSSGAGNNKDLAAEVEDLVGWIQAAKAVVQKEHDAEAASESQSKHLQDSLTTCAKGASVLAAAAADLSLGAGVRVTGAAGKIADLSSPGGVGWLGWRIPIGVPSVVLKNGDVSLKKVTADDQDQLKAIASGNLNYFQLGGSFRYDADDRFVTGNSKTPVVQADEFDAWAGIQWNYSWFRIGGQAGYSKVSTVQASQKSFDQSAGRWLAQADFKVGSTGVWIGGSYGNSNGTTTRLHDKVALLTVYFSPPSALSLLGK